MSKRRPGADDDDDESRDLYRGFKYRTCSRVKALNDLGLFRMMPTDMGDGFATSSVLGQFGGKGRGDVDIARRLTDNVRPIMVLSRGVHFGGGSSGSGDKGGKGGRREGWVEKRYDVPV